MALFGGKTPAQLTLSDAIMTGFRMVTFMNFVIPILVIGVIVNAIVITAILPILLAIVIPHGATDPTVLGGAIVASIIGAVLGGIVGGLILNLYGQVWATMASVGDAPTIEAAFARVGLRWISILGAGVIVGVVTVGILLVGGILAALLGPLGFVVLLAAAIAAIYMGARLSMAGWLAADGSAAMEAAQTSWTMTEGKLLLIIGWGLAFGIVFGIVGGILGSILGIIPFVGPALAQTVSVAFGYGGGVTLYRRVRGS